MICSPASRFPGETAFLWIIQANKTARTALPSFVVLPNNAKVEFYLTTRPLIKVWE